MHTNCNLRNTIQICYSDVIEFVLNKVKKFRHVKNEEEKEILKKINKIIKCKKCVAYYRVDCAMRKRFNRKERSLQV